MLSAAITIMFAFAGMLALASIAQSLLAARAAWARLMREGEVMQAGLALQARAAGEMRLRSAALAAARPRAVATRRPGMLRPLPLPACAAA